MKLKNQNLKRSDLLKTELKIWGGRTSRVLAWCWATLPRRIVSCIIIASILLSSIWFLFLKPAPVEASWWDDDWLYRKSVLVTNNTVAENNVYISITIDTSDTTKVQADCGDLRFTKLNGDALDYFIVSGCGTASTVTHIFFDVLDAGAQTIYYYYGNPSADNGFKSADFSTVASNYTVGTIGSEEKGNGPVLYLKFDEGYGTTAYDSSGQNNDGTITGATWSDTGKFGKALDFDGSDDVTTITQATSINLTSKTEYTISAWIYPHTDGEGDAGQFISKGANTYLRVDTESGGRVDVEGKLDLATTDANLNISSAIPTNQWSHILMAYTDDSDDEISIYINGVLAGTSSGGDGSPATDSNDLLIGGSTSANFDGLIDEVKIYPYARTVAQIKVDYNRGAAVRIGGGTPIEGLAPIAEWKMDEGSGASAQDTSANANTGTITGATWKNSAQCHSGSCLSFDGDDYVLSDSAINLTNKSTSIFAWLNPTDLAGSSYPHLFSQRASGDTQGIRFIYDYADAGSIGNYVDVVLEIDGSRQDCSTATGTQINITEGIWQLLGFTFDGTNVKIYKNGTLIKTCNLPGNLNTDAGKFTIGADMQGTGNSWRAKGLIDEVKVFDYALTARQVAELYAGTSPEMAENPVNSTVGHWKFDEGQGTTAQDYSGQDNDLTLSAESYTMSGKFGKAWNGTGATYLSRADDADFDFAAADDFSISTWFKSDSTTNPSSGVEWLVEKKASSAGYGIYMDTDGDVIFGVDDDTTWDPDDKVGDIGKDYYDNTWHHFVGVKTGTSKIEAYVDGVKIESDTSLAATGTLANSALLYLGDSDGTNNGDEFNGDMDETKIFRFALTAEDVKMEYNQGKAVQMGSNQNSQWCPPGFAGTCTAPIGEWKMDEGSGASVQDTSANANTGTITGATWKNAASCKFGSCLSFDGSGDYVSTGNVDASKVTVSAWVKFTSAQIGTDQRIISKWGNTTAERSYLLTTDNSSVYQFRFALRTSDTGICDSVSTYSPGIWYHVVGVYDGANCYLYVNGVQDYTQVNNPPDGNLQSSSTTMRIGIEGDDASTGPFNGQIDDVKIYDYALTQEQISWLYNNGKPVGYWKFDEGQGSTAKDSSVNNLSGTITEATWSTSGKYNSALTYDGTNDVTTVTQNSAINATSKTGYAISAWVYPHTDGEGDVGQFISKGTNTYLRVDTESGGRVDVEGKLDLATTDATLNISSAIATNQWSHILMSYKDDDDDEISIYVNGVLAGTSSGGDGSPATDSNDLLIGGSTSANFDGLIDEVKIYNYEPTTEQVKLDYNQGAALRFGQ